MLAIGVERHHTIRHVEGRKGNFPFVFVDLDTHDRAGPYGLTLEHEYDLVTLYPPYEESFDPSDYSVAH